MQGSEQRSWSSVSNSTLLLQCSRSGGLQQVLVDRLIRIFIVGRVRPRLLQSFPGMHGVFILLPNKSASTLPTSANIHHISHLADRALSRTSSIAGRQSFIGGSTVSVTSSTRQGCRNLGSRGRGRLVCSSSKLYSPQNAVDTTLAWGDILTLAATQLVSCSSTRISNMAGNRRLMPTAMLFCSRATVCPSLKWECCAQSWFSPGLG